MGKSHRCFARSLLGSNVCLHICKYQWRFLFYFDISVNKEPLNPYCKFLFASSYITWNACVTFIRIFLQILGFFTIIWNAHSPIHAVRPKNHYTSSRSLKLNFHYVLRSTSLAYTLQKSFIFIYKDLLCLVLANVSRNKTTTMQTNTRWSYLWVRHTECIMKMQVHKTFTHPKKKKHILRSDMLSYAMFWASDMQNS